MKFFVAVSCLLFAVVTAQDGGTCPQLQNFVNGVCDQSSLVTCRHPCTEEVITGRENCTVNYCCVNGRGECVLNQPRVQATASVDLSLTAALLSGQLEESRREDRENATEQARFGNVSPVPGAGYCPPFPYSCSPVLPVGPQAARAFIPPVNIPYCQRIACSASNPFLDSDFNACIANPGCYFDQELFRYRNLIGQSILPGVPVCQMAIRNSAFRTRAQQAATRLGTWNPLLTECVMTQFRSEIFGNAVGCELLDYLVYFGHTPKRAGWTGITQHDCILIGACWRETSTGNFCAYPSNSQGRPTIRSSNDGNRGRNPRRGLFGLPVCHPLNPASQPAQFLSSYHTCLASGCAANVDYNLLQQHLLSFQSQLTFPLNTQYINMVYSGAARPDNYVSVLQSLQNAPSIFPTRLPHFTFPGIPYNLNLRNASRSFGLYPSPVGAGAGAGASAGAGAGAGAGFLFGAGASAGAGAGANLNAAGLAALFPGVGLQRPRPPVNPCPYSPQRVHFPGIPRLTGILTGCCDTPLCYLPKPDLYDPYSGISSYLSNWSQWTQCPVTCGGGLRNRTRQCVGGNCNPNELLSQTHTCNVGRCPYYSNWSGYSECSLTCGGGVRTRSRTCQGTGQCRGPSRETRPCRTGVCPTFEYSTWSSCSTTCGRGVRRRQQRCTNGGAYGCPTPSVDEENCEQFCGSQSVTCNPTTCCYERTPCVQPNRQPGYCVPDRIRTGACSEGFCFFVAPQNRCQRPMHLG